MKDPAFLFYSSDFITGVSDLTMEERGQYITLLCLHHQKGRLTKKNIQIAVPNATADVLAKFKIDEKGLYYNSRLELESEKRKEHAVKQRDRALKGWEKRKSHDITTANAAALPLEDVSEGVIKNKSLIKKEKEIPTENEFLEHCKVVCQSKYESLEFSLKSKYQTWIDDGWKTGHNKPIKNWKNTINNTIPFLKPANNGTKQNDTSERKQSVSDLKSLSETILDDYSAKNSD